METLGLSSAKSQEDGLFRRLVWPTITNQYDVDLIGRRGFWLALAVGIVSCIGVSVQGNWLIGLLVLVVFVLGAAGIRERSVAASALILAIYALGIVGSWGMALLGYGNTGNPFVGIVLLMLLCANLRATILSQRWLALGVDSEFPEREDGAAMNAVVNRFPRTCWPWGRYIFFVLAPIYILLTLVGFAAISLKAKIVPVPQSRPVHVQVVPGS